MFAAEPFFNGLLTRLEGVNPVLVQIFQAGPRK